MKKQLVTVFVLLISLAVFMAMPVSAAGYTADITIYGTEDYDEINEVYKLVNQERAAEGLPELKLDPVLMDYAMQRAAECSVYYSHTRPNGTRCSTVFDSRFPGSYGGENIAAGYQDAAAVMTGWMNSDGHRANILRSDTSSIGIGCFYQENGTKYWVQLFGFGESAKAYSGSGKKDVHNIPIQIDREFLNLELKYFEACVGVNVYEGLDTRFYLQVSNKGYRYATPVSLDGGYSLTTANESILQVKDGTSLIGKKVGTTQVTIHLDGGMLSVSLEVSVVPRPFIKAEVDSNGDHQISWQDDYNAVTLYGKPIDDDMWSLLASPSSRKTFRNYFAQDGEVWIYVLRAKNAEGIPCDVSDTVTAGYLPAPNLHVPHYQNGNRVLKWDTRYGAKQYEVYCGTSADGPFEKLGTTTKTEYPFVDIKVGDTRFYKVRAIGDHGIVSAFSRIHSCTRPLDVPQVNASVSSSSGKTKLTWDAVKEAESYTVYRATGPITYRKPIAKVTSTKFTDKTAKAGDEFYYWVVAEHADSKLDSDWSEPVQTLCKLEKPVVDESNVSSSGKIKLKWQAIDGAVKYKIYRRVGKSGDYEYYKTVYTNEFTDKSTTSGKVYYYKVKAAHLNESANSSKSSGVGQTCKLPQPEVEESNVTSSGKIKLEWDKISGAKEYNIYRASSKTGTYKKLADTDGTSYTDKTAKVGKVYYYKVKAIHKNSNANSAYSSVAAQTCKLERPDVTVSLSSGKPRLKWDEVDGAKEYKIYRATSKSGTYKAIKTTTSEKYTDKSAKKGTTYYYKVKAIHSKSSANSAYSSVDSVKSK